MATRTRQYSHTPFPAGRPEFSESEALEFVQKLYGLQGKACALPSERDQNFLVETTDGRRYVFKLANSNESRQTLDFQNHLMTRLSEHSGDSPGQQLIQSQANEQVVILHGRNGATHYARLLSYVPGKRLVDVRPHTPDLLRSLGRFLARLDHSLLDFSHAAAERELDWDLARASEVVERHITEIEDAEGRELVQYFHARYRDSAAPRLTDLRRSVIHGDANDHNVLVEDGLWQKSVAGIIDFGDAVKSHLINELAIASAYALLDKPDPIAAAAHVVSGYHEILPLREIELEVLFYLTCMRLCVSVCKAAHNKKHEPADAYLTVSEEAAYHALARLHGISANFACYTFRQACGLPPCPKSSQVVGWLKNHTDKFASVVKHDLKTAPHVVFDLGIGSLERGSQWLSQSAAGMTRWIFQRMADAGADVGLGRYNEARQLYSGEQFRNAAGEWRTVHIGMDIFMPAGSPVFAPFAGRVHSFQNNEAWRDYGPTIILEHSPESDITLYTLYGHLSLDSLNDLHIGQQIKAGQQIAAMGDFPENGDWPPHLHFQIILDMLGKTGDFPGVAPASQREIWLGMCPDPNLILQAPQPQAPKTGRSKPEIMRSRAQRLGPSLSVSYKEPLKIVRGNMQYLYDETGRAYLDAVNNVAHVGHCHPHVVQAIRKQVAVLNTNTRYLHDNLVEYADRLCATLPAPLQVCYFVCSGSEANELALRMARAHTGARDVIVLESAYHGNTTSLVEISPYKFDGPGGAGKPLHVHKVPAPDVYRGMFKSEDPDAGKKYADEVDKALRIAAKNRHQIGAFFCESILSCAGQIVLPAGYLARAYKHLRKAGVVCVADEVQVGFGRAGSHFWAFEPQGVIPDIVTMGKPMGNGHPLAAVVTTPEIAASFNSGMEYFNTYGGNPVACAAGLAVLDVIEREGLQENARLVGAQLLDGLRVLQNQHALIGDVRGLGLFIGVEFVQNPETREPATDEAAYIVERMKDLGVLLSTDGPFRNVIKIKPPLVFSRENADLVIGTLREVLEDSCLRRYKV